jgi:hypothetical protein
MVRRKSTAQAFADGMIASFDLFGVSSREGHGFGHTIRRYSPEDTRPGFVKDAEALREDAEQLRRDGMALFGFPAKRSRRAR